MCDNKEQLNRFSGEYKLLEQYKTVNNLIKNLKNSEDIFTCDLNKTYEEESLVVNNNYIHHLKEDINYHLNDFIDVKGMKSQKD